MLMCGWAPLVIEPLCLSVLAEASLYYENTLSLVRTFFEGLTNHVTSATRMLKQTNCRICVCSQSASGRDCRVSSGLAQTTLSHSATDCRTSPRTRDAADSMYTVPIAARQPADGDALDTGAHVPAMSSQIALAVGRRPRRRLAPAAPSLRPLGLLPAIIAFCSSFAGVERFARAGWTSPRTRERVSPVRSALHDVPSSSLTNRPCEPRASSSSSIRLSLATSAEISIPDESASRPEGPAPAARPPAPALSAAAAADGRCWCILPCRWVVVRAWRVVCSAVTRRSAKLRESSRESNRSQADGCAATADESTRSAAS